MLAPARAFGASLSELRQAVFKIQVMSSDPNFTDPWKKQPPTSSSGTGFYIGDRRILTNAHVIANATFITVLRDGDSQPQPAYVKFVAHDADLAMLELRDGKVLDGLAPMRFGSLPKLRSPVSTIGFPMGGEQISVTEGVVSRVSYRRYVHDGSARHLLVQVDSAINPGNSGGPVVQGRTVVGVAFQSLTQADNTGYIIPTPVINRFLKDIEDGQYDGHPDDGLTTSDGAMLNPSTSAFHGLPPEQGGVKIAHVARWATTYGPLKDGDIILELAGQAIGDDGKVQFQGERVDFCTVFDLRQIGDVVPMKIVRDGSAQTVDVKVGKAKPHAEPEYIYAKHAKYFVHAGLVFTALNRSYLRTWGERWYKEAPLLLRFLDSYARYEPDTEADGDIMVLAKRLPDAVNAYATGNVFGVVKAVDGKQVNSFPELIQALEHGTGVFEVIDFMGSVDPLVLSRNAVQARNDAINKKYGVVPDRWLTGPENDGAIGKGDEP